MLITSLSLSLFSLLAFVERVHCDYYTSVSGLEKLLKLEKHYLESLETHLQAVENKYKEFDSLLDEIEFEQAKVQDDAPQYYEDPINSFKTIRRVVVDWKQLQHLTLQIRSIKVYNESTATIPADKLSPPTEDDLSGAARGLARLQHLYKLDSASIAKGYIKGQKYGSAMTEYNCFVLGHSLYESKNYVQASEWLIEALHKAQDIENRWNDKDQDIDDLATELEQHNSMKEQNQYVDEDEEKLGESGIYPYASIVQILEYLGLALYNSGNRKLALAMNSKLLGIEPENELGLANKDLFERGVKAESRSQTVTPPPAVSESQRLYEQVCNGELQQSAQEKRHLRCRYATNNKPFYLVGPLKMEELNADPAVVFYHEVINDSEIEYILRTVQQSIARSRVGSEAVASIDEDRTSKNAWLDFEDRTFLLKLSQRLQDITGLSMETAEMLQVANYGIGGHYGVHWDFEEDHETEYPAMGNRLLTAMFYINDVDLGGATAFPFIHLAVPATKRSLVVWYNLHKSLEPDYRVLHAGCPVLKGSKWIANEWFHSVGQEFKRPCGLEADDAISKPYEAFGLDYSM